jgi:hypothetical protein
MPKLTICGGFAIFDDSSSDYPSTRQISSRQERVAGTLGADGTDTQEIVDGLSKEIVGQGFIGEPLIQSNLSAEIISDTQVKVYSDVGADDEDRDYYVTLQRAS